MLRRHIISSLMVILAVHPASAQEWMERFLQERATERARPAQTPQPSADERIPPPSATSLRDVIPAESTPEVRRARPVTPAAQEEESFDPDAPVRRAQPVEPVEAAPVVIEEEPTPTPAPRRARRTTREALERPITIPDGDNDANTVPAATPAPVAMETPESSKPENQLENLDPRGNEIRLSPGATTAPADVLQFSYANRLYAQKDYERAIYEFERYLSLYNTGNDRQAALYRLAESYRLTKTYNAAKKNYETLIYNYQMGDFVGPASYRLAEIYFIEKDYAGAANFFHKASVWLKEPALVLSAKYYQARSQEALLLTREAIRTYEEVLETKENNPFREASQLALVNLLSRAGQKNQALLLLELIRGESQKPAILAEAAVRTGLLHLELNQNEKAVKELSAALQMKDLGPWREMAEVGLLRVYYNDGKYKEVIDIYTKSPGKFSPNAAAEILLVVANSHRQLHQYEEANKIYDEIRQKYAKTPYAEEANYERLVALYNIGSDELIAAVDAYLEANPEANQRHDQLVLMKAEFLYKQQRWPEAARVYASLGEAVLSPAVKAEATFKLGWCYTRTGAYDLAINAFTELLTKYPPNKLTATALAQRGYCYEQTRDLPAALKDFERLLKDFKSAKEREYALLHKALIHGQQEESRRMVEAFTLLLQEFPESPAAGQANYWIGLTALQARDYKNSIKPLIAARTIDKEFADRATGHLMAAYLALEDRQGLGREIDQADPKIQIRPQMLRWAGNAFLNANEAESAIKYLQLLIDKTDASSLEPTDWLALGKAYTLQQEWDKAGKALNDYLQKTADPIPRARGYLALSEAQLGARDYDGALASAQQVQQLQPEGQYHALGRILAGDVAMARKQYQEAAKLFLSVSIVYEDPAITPLAMEKACQAYDKAGEKEKAGKTLNELQTRYPEYELSQPTAAIQG